MKCNTNREERNQFDHAASSYEAVRPGYPTQVFNEITSYGHLTAESMVLEIGMGSGQATEQLLKQGFNVTAIEPGKNLSDIARKKFSRYPDFQLFTVYFEEFESNKTFDLITSATAFHWLDPAIAYKKCWALLKEEGVFAPFWTMMPTVEPAIEKMLKGIFNRYAPDLIQSMFGSSSMESVLAEGEDELRETRLFKDLTFIRIEWQKTYRSADYITLLDTYANFQSLDRTVKKNVFHAIQTTLDCDFDGEVTNHYLTALHLGRKVTTPGYSG